MAEDKTYQCCQCDEISTGKPFQGDYSRDHQFCSIECAVKWLLERMENLRIVS
jgi:hypothetical protein